MKIFVQIVDLNSGIYQTGMIDEPVQKGCEVANAIGHFGVNINEVEWENRTDLHSFGKIRNTTKVVSVITSIDVSPNIVKVCPTTSLSS